MNLRVEPLIELINKRYSECNGYSDTGEAIFSGGSERLSFKTVFRRGQLFSFDWQDVSSKAAKSDGFSTLAWNKGATSFKRVATNGSGTMVENEDFQQCASLAAGCSAGAASIIGPLLDTDLFNSKGILDLDPNQKVVEEDGAYVICGSQKGTELKIWVSKSESVIDRVEAVTAVPASELAAAYDAFNDVLGPQNSLWMVDKKEFRNKVTYTFDNIVLRR